MPDIFVAANNQKTEDRRQPLQSRDPATAGKTNSRKTDKIERSSDIRPASPAGGHPKHSMFPLAAFAVDPLGVHFATQGEKEAIHLFLRRHFVTNIPWILISAILLIVPVFFLPFATESLPLASLLSGSAIFVLVLFYYTAVFGIFILINFINWYFNVYIVTRERVVDVDFVNILYREVSATRLNLIQDVTTRTGGVIRAIFNYGDVFIQTAGTEVNFDFHAVPRPQDVAREIEKLMEQARKSEGASELEEAMER